MLFEIWPGRAAAQPCDGSIGIAHYVAAIESLAQLIARTMDSSKERAWAGGGTLGESRSQDDPLLCIQQCSSGFHGQQRPLCSSKHNSNNVVLRAGRRWTWRCLRARQEALIRL